MAEAKKPAATPAKTTAAKAKAPAAAKATAAKAKAPAAAKATAAKAEAPAAAKATAAKAPASVGTASKPKASATPKTASTAKKPKAPAEKDPTLRVHHLRPAKGANTPKTRVGRGEGGRRGKTAGRGTKGTKARYQVSPQFEGGQTPIHMRIPKLRGFTNPFRVTYQVVNLSTLARLYPKGGDVTKADLVEKGAVRKNEPVKVLGDGDLGVKLRIVDADRVSRSARTKIEDAGGSINLD